ncbi:MAG TPA: efflux RND transporter periplasmic adaptor subunit [Candidatus Xenobia bacterium]
MADEPPAQPSVHEGTHIEPLEPPPRTSWGCMVLALLVLVAGGYAGWRWYQQAPQQEGSQKPKVHPVPVRVAKVKHMTVPVEVHGVGNVLAYSTVTVTSQVTGQLIKVFFKEGDFVTKGQPLFEIDPRPQQASVAQVQANIQKDTAQIGQLQATVERDQANVNQAQATLRRDLAQEHFARTEEGRYHLLQRQGYVTVEQWQQEKATLDSSAATVGVDRATISSAEETMKADRAAISSQAETRAADEASLRNAQVQLSYTYITAPVTGRAGGLNVYGGNIVTAGGATPLVTIYQIRPIYISFAVPERYLTMIQTLQGRHPLQVEVGFNDQVTPSEWGRLTFIDNSVDTTTGTIMLRGTFANPTNHLWPGRFVTITLLLENEENAVVVPSQAVQPGQNGDYVFVLQPDNTVDMRNVQVERIVGENSVIRSGLRAGETVVTDGQLQLNPHTPVELAGTGHHRGGGGQAPEGSGSPEASGAPEPGASGSPAGGGGHHHRHASPTSSDTTSRATPPPSRGQQPVAFPTEPVGAGPAIPPSPSALTGLNFPGGGASPGTLVISPSPTSVKGGGAVAASVATSAPAQAPTGLPGTVNQPAGIARPGTLNTLQPVAASTAGAARLLSNPPTFSAGPPSIPKPGPSTPVLTASPSPTPSGQQTAATTTSPTATASSGGGETTTRATTPAAQATVTGPTANSTGSSGGKSK